MTILVPLVSSAPPVIAPHIASLSPDSGLPSYKIRVFGDHFTGATSVTFNGTTASFIVDEDSQISAYVPTGATTGNVVVTTPSGTSNGIKFVVTSFSGSKAYVDWVAQYTVGSYTPSLLAFPSVIDTVTNTTYPAVQIPLYVKEHPVPIRKQKVTEINTLPLTEPLSGFDMMSSSVFFGSPDLLQVEIQGWVITPQSSNSKGFWTPTVDGTSSGTSLNLPNNSYVDLITAYLEGRMGRNSSGRWQRVDPAYYIDPYGRQYNNPVIGTWEPGYSVTTKKTPFSMQLYFETGQ